MLLRHLLLQRYSRSKLLQCHNIRKQLRPVKDPYQKEQQLHWLSLKRDWLRSEKNNRLSMHGQLATNRVSERIIIIRLLISNDLVRLLIVIKLNILYLHLNISCSILIFSFAIFFWRSYSTIRTLISSSADCSFFLNLSSSWSLPLL